MSDFIPILILGDAPNLTTGLARIARDVTAMLYADQIGGRLPVPLPIKVAQLGLGYDGSPWPWPVYPVTDEANWAEGDLQQVYEWHCGDRPGVVFSFWDPARCVGTAFLKLPYGAERWGYFAVDGHNALGGIGGPAQGALLQYRRVLAYSQFGARVLAKAFPEHDQRLQSGESGQWIPHGIDTETFRPYREGDEVTGVVAELLEKFFWQGSETRLTVGVVAANQPRKDFGLVFEALERFAAQGPGHLRPKLWIHTDRPIFNAWSLPELASVYARNSPELTVVTSRLKDPELAQLYAQCDVTIAPGLGEGFGYPIAESLSCGVPVIHGSYGAGAELIPMPQFVVSPSAWRVEGTYAIQRPVYDALDVADVLRHLNTWQREPEYWRGAVAHLDWRALWPRWRSWITKGLKELIGGQQEQREAAVGPAPAGGTAPEEAPAAPQADARVVRAVPKAVGEARAREAEGQGEDHRPGAVGDEEAGGAAEGRPEELEAPLQPCPICGTGTEYGYCSHCQAMTYPKGRYPKPEDQVGGHRRPEKER